MACKLYKMQFYFLSTDIIIELRDEDAGTYELMIGSIEKTKPFCLLLMFFFVVKNIIIKKIEKKNSRK